MSNKYVHPHLFKGTRLTREGGKADMPGDLCACALALRWADIRRIEAVGDPAAIFDDDALTCQVTYLGLKGGGVVYVLDPLAEVLAAWACWLNDASLSFKKLSAN